MRSWNGGQIAIVGILIALLILVIVWAVSVWTASADVEMGKHGWIALILGTTFSLVIGCGLMALMFYSSRSGFDEAADPLRRDMQEPGTPMPEEEQNRIEQNRGREP